MDNQRGQNYIYKFSQFYLNSSQINQMGIRFSKNLPVIEQIVSLYA